MQRVIGLLLVMGAVELAGANNARAETIHYSYAWLINAPVVGDPTGFHVRIGPTESVGTILAVVGPPILWNNFDVQIMQTGPSQSPPVTVNQAVSFDLRLTDQASSQVGDFHFTVKFHGTFGANDNNLSLLTFSQAPQFLNLGDHLYQAETFETWGAVSAGPLNLEVGAAVSVLPAPAPEPSSMVLGGVAVVGLAAGASLRCRRHGA
jgi:hypothetical protein